jgi:tetratricopeptide (TPR) repeat protein
LSINRNDENTIIYLGRAHASAGNFQESLKILKLLENKTSIETDARYHLAMAYGKIGDQGMSHYHFGLFFKENKKKESAVFHFKAALKYLAQDDPRRHEIEKEIGELEKDKIPKIPDR